jgi:hypothetical protein
MCWPGMDVASPLECQRTLICIEKSLGERRQLPPPEDMTILVNILSGKLILLHRRTIFSSLKAILI